MGTSGRDFDSTILERLERENWDEILPEVLSYANCKTKRYQAFLGVYADPEELIHEAIALAFGVGKDGSYRNWDPSKYPRIVDFLTSVVDSLLSHSVAQHKKVKHISRDERPNEGSTSIPIVEVEESLAANVSIEFHSPEEKFLIAEKVAATSQFLKRLSDEDYEIGLLLMAIEEGAEKPREQAKILGVDVAVVYNIRKRLNRKIDAFVNSDATLFGKRIC